MAERMANRHFHFRSTKHHGPVFISNGNAQIFELRKVLFHRIIKRKFPFIHQHHDRRTGERFRHGRDPENVFLRDRHLFLDVRPADTVDLHLAAVPQDRDHTGHFSGINERLESITNRRFSRMKEDTPPNNS